ncbi:MAG: hypothetical protein GX030_07665 [Firmicutes bacterium]|nr:hypothetical protein [Bacillota bacterium]
MHQLPKYLLGKEIIAGDEFMMMLAKERKDQYSTQLLAVGISVSRGG